MRRAAVTRSTSLDAKARAARFLERIYAAIAKRKGKVLKCEEQFGSASAFAAPEADMAAQPGVKKGMTIALRAWPDIIIDQLGDAFGPAVTLGELVSHNQVLIQDLVTPHLVSRMCFWRTQRPNAERRRDSAPDRRRTPYLSVTDVR